MKKIIEILSSKALLVWILGCWIVYYVLTAIWTTEAFATFVTGISRSLFFKIPFVLFLISGFCNLIRASGEYLKKGKFYFVCRVLLPLGVMIFFTGFFLSLSTKQFKWIVAGEGQSIRTPWSPETYMITGIEPGLRESFLDIEEDGIGIFAYEPKVTLSDRSSQLYEIGAFPPTRIGRTYYHILNFGFAPGVRLSDGTKVLEEGYIPLRLLPPGSNDSFEISSYPYRFLINLEPEKVVRKENVTASQFSLKSPIYRVRILKGENIVTETVSTEKITFDDFALSFFEPAFWVQIEVVKDIGSPIMLAGIIFICIGLPFYILAFGISVIYNK